MVSAWIVCIAAALLFIVLILLGRGRRRVFRASAPVADGLVPVSSHIERGVALFNADGSEFGTVTDFSEKHDFPAGVMRGVDVEGFWYRRDFILETKFVKAE